MEILSDSKQKTTKHILNEDSKRPNTAPFGLSKIETVSTASLATYLRFSFGGDFLLSMLAQALLSHC